MAAANRAAAAPYLHAYMYFAARRASAANVQLLHFAIQQLNLEPAAARGAVEQLLGAQLVCPLDGEYQLVHSVGCSHWTSTAWQRASYYDETHCPENYRFPFLDWLRGLHAELNLSRDTLSANVHLQTKRSQTAPGKGP
jgi:hypothetical protein